MRVGLVAAALAAFVIVASPAAARAADSIYWNWAKLSSTAVVAGGMSFANLDGSGANGVPVSGATVDHPLGMAIDAAMGKIYWANFGRSIEYCSGALPGGNTISFANLDGTGGRALNTGGATVSGPDGLAIDPAARRLYWANDHGNSISYANLDGTGGHDLNTAGATVRCPAGLAVDPAAGRVYWTNFKADSISYAKLDGSGGGDLKITGGTISGPYGLAIDAPTGKIYWTNYHANSISYANRDGSGGEDLTTTGASVNGPWGLAIDHAAGKIYWANNLGTTISYARLNESGGGDLIGAVDHPKYPELLKVPSAAGPPVVRGGATSGSDLSCSHGTWAADLPEAFLYRAPERFAYRWSKNGTPIVETSKRIMASSPGSYACEVIATNYAGSTRQASAPFTVVAPPADALRVTSWTVSSGGAIDLAVFVPGPGALNGTATFRQKTYRFTGTGRRRRRLTKWKKVAYGSAMLGTTAAGTSTLTINPTIAAVNQLRASKKVRVTLVVAFTPTAGAVSRARLSVIVRTP